MVAMGDSIEPVMYVDNVLNKNSGTFLTATTPVCQYANQRRDAFCIVENPS